MRWFLKITYVRGSFPLNERRQMCCPHFKKVTLSASKTIVQFLFSLFVAKYLNVYFVTACSFFFGKWSNLDLDQAFLVPTSYYQLHTKFFQHLMMVTKSAVFFSIYLKRLREFGKKVCFQVTTKWDIRKTYYFNKKSLVCRKQRVVLNGQHSLWADVKVGILQGSILGTLLFLLYINNLPFGLNSNAKLFADA